MNSTERRKTESFDSFPDKIDSFERKTKKIVPYATVLVLLYDFFCFFLGFFNIFLWDSLNRSVFREKPLTNFVILSVILLICKAFVFFIGFFSVYRGFTKNSARFLRFFAISRICETFLAASMKFVYCVGLANFAYQNCRISWKNHDFNGFLIVFCVYNAGETCGFFAMNVFFCKIVWKNIEKMEKRREESIEMQANLNAF